MAAHRSLKERVLVLILKTVVIFVPLQLVLPVGVAVTVAFVATGFMRLAWRRSDELSEPKQRLFER